MQIQQGEGIIVVFWVSPQHRRFFVSAKQRSQRISLPNAEILSLRDTQFAAIRPRRKDRFVFLEILDLDCHQNGLFQVERLLLEFRSQVWHKVIQFEKRSELLHRDMTVSCSLLIVKPQSTRQKPTRQAARWALA